MPRRAHDVPNPMPHTDAAINCSNDVTTLIMSNPQPIRIVTMIINTKGGILNQSRMNSVTGDGNLMKEIVKPVTQEA